MQGSLREIDVRSLLAWIELSQRTGELLIESATGQFWFIFCANGSIIYATQSPPERSRLSEYLWKYQLELPQASISPSRLGFNNAPEYGQIWELLEADQISPAIASQIIQALILEVLFDLLPLHQGMFSFEASPALFPQLCPLWFSSYAAQISKQLRHWQAFFPHIYSAHQCPTLSPTPENSTSASQIQLDPRCLDGKTSLRQSARFLGKNLLEVSQIVYQAFQAGLVNLDSHQAIAVTPLKKNIRIVCIDDSITTCRAVEYMLNQQGYQITAISNPIRALSLVFQLQPTLIFCDIEMPELDGYELCTMLRKSSTFAYTPIIMLTGRDAFIDRVKARVAGATDYLTKPFGEQELLAIVEKYANTAIASSVSAKLAAYLPIYSAKKL